MLKTSNQSRPQNLDHQLVKGAGYLCKPIAFKISKIRNLNRGGRHSPDFKGGLLKNASLLCSLYSSSLLLHKKGTFSEELLLRVDREIFTLRLLTQSRLPFVLPMPQD